MKNQYGSIVIEGNNFDISRFDFQSVEHLEKQFGSPLYILHVEKLRKNYRKMERAFKSRYENFIIGYSYKTNYIPYLCKELNQLGAYAEVVSRLEYDLALKLGVHPERIIFNGPVKTYGDYEQVFQNKSIINIDSLYEIGFIEEYCKKHDDEIVKVGIRVNFPLQDEESENVLQEGYSISRFGICLENGQFEEAMKRLNAINNVQLVGFHGHFSTKDRAVKHYEKITKKLCELAKTYIHYGLEYIDVGGGIFGEMHPAFNIKTPTIDDYAEAICNVMNKEFANCTVKPKLILEPGISMVANTVLFLTKVIEVKKVQDQYFVVTNGSVHNIKPTMHKTRLPMKIIQRSLENEKETFHIVGYTCMEKDYIASNVLEILPKVGDYILFENVGAYTIVFNPPFIQTRPGIVAYHDSKWKLVRKQEKFEQFFNEQLYLF